MSEENVSFRMGIRDGVPIALGYLAVSFAFGLMAVKEGLSVLEAVFISMFNVTSAGQIAALPIISVGGSLIELALTQVVINMRYALMSVSLSQRFGKSVTLGDRFAFGFMNTDEIFAVACGKETPLGRKYMYGLIVSPFFGWVLGTLLGAVAGEVLPALLVSALSASMYAMFIAILVPAAKARLGTLFAILAAIGVSALLEFVPIFSVIPSGFRVIICAVSVSLLFAFISPVESEVDEKC